MMACGLCRNIINGQDKTHRTCGIMNKKIGKNITTKPHWCPINNTKRYSVREKPRPVDMCDLMCGRGSW